MPDSQSRTTDRTCIVRTLTHIARRLRFARVTRELLQGFTLSLILPIALSVFYRFVEMSRAVVFIFLGLWVLGLAGSRCSLGKRRCWTPPGPWTVRPTCTTS